MRTTLFALTAPARRPIFPDLLAACRTPGALVPGGATPVSRSRSAAWVAATIPSEHRLHRVQVALPRRRSSAGGRGSARIAPPDSLRFDVAGPVRQRRERRGRSWAIRRSGSSRPTRLQKLVPNYPLLWAMFGVARMPAEGAELARAGGRRASPRGSTPARRDTVDVCPRTGGAPGTAGRRGAAGRRAWSGGRRPRSAPTARRSAARLTVPERSGPARCHVLSTTRADFAPEIWLRVAKP